MCFPMSTQCLGNVRNFVLSAQLISYFVLATIPSYIRKFMPLAILFGCVTRFVLGRIGNPKDRFTLDATRMSWNFEEGEQIQCVFPKSF